MIKIKKNLPLVSICIPTYNAEKYINETLNSILKQSYDNIEIIIGDNASNDNTEQLVQEFNNTHNLDISYYKNLENLGYSGNCNKLIGLANGEFVAIYHSDDVYNPDIIKEQVALLVEDKALAGCFTGFTFIDSNSVDKKIWLTQPSNKKLTDVTIYNYDVYINKLINKYQNPLFCPSSMIRKKAYDLVGGYNENIKFVEDQDMWIRLLEHYNLAVINREMVQYRIHAQQGSAIYNDITREKVSPMIKHISEHLLIKHGKSEYYAKYKSKIDRLLAVDDIRLAFHLLKQSRGLTGLNKYKQFILNSKMKYRFKVSEYDFLRFSIFQWLPIRITYFLLNMINKVRN